MFAPVYISSTNCITPLGNTIQENWNSLLQEDTGIGLHDVGHFKSIYTSKIFHSGVTESKFTFLETLLLDVAKPLVDNKKISNEVGFVLSTTKGNIDFLKNGKADEAELFKLAEKVAKKLGFENKPIVVSHACVSGLLAVIVAKRLIQMGRYKEVLVLAADQVSEFVVSGFNAFQAMSDEPCRPFDRDRKGVTLGEAVAAAWVTSEKTNSCVEILGEGVINDANHISGPSRTGEGLYQSISSALKEAKIMSSEVDFISSHGTATLYNDEMEAIAFDRLGLIDKPVNSLKGFYGHTLGASGLLELVISIESLKHNTLIPTKGFENNGTSKNIQVVKEVTEREVRVVLKTASGFGGSNAAVLIKKI